MSHPKSPHTVDGRNVAPVSCGKILRYPIFCVPQGAGFLPSTIWILGLKLGSYPIEPFFTTQISNLHPSNISNQQGCWFSQNWWIKNTSVLFVPKKDCSSWAIYIYIHIKSAVWVWYVSPFISIKKDICFHTRSKSLKPLKCGALDKSSIIHDCLEGSPQQQKSFRTLNPSSFRKCSDQRTKDLQIL